VLQAALVEAIQPWCGPARPGRRGARPRERREARQAGGEAQLPQLNPRQWRGIGRDVLALHEGYTQRRGAFAHEENPIHTRLPAYQLYYLPRNWYRVHRVLQELPWSHADARATDPSPIPLAWRDPSAREPMLRLLDLGCGTGAWSLAWLGWLAERLSGRPRNAEAPGAPGTVQPTTVQPTSVQPTTVHLTLVDQGHTLLELALANLQAYARRALPGVTLRWEVHADGVEAFLAGPPAGAPYAVAGAAMTLNELGLLGPRRVSERAAGLAGALQARLLPGGCLLFVEPGTRKGYMNLMVLREQLLHLPVLYPCPHNEPCPMWDGGVRHWCHATERLPPGFFFDAALRERAGLGFDMRDLQMAALAFQAQPAQAPGDPFRPRVGERIVSAPLKPRGPAGGAAGDASRVVLACAPDGALHERPAPPGGPYTRGRWSPAQGAGRP
jgi:Mitochondrial small ribosomal subunit Rsm22